MNIQKTLGLKAITRYGTHVTVTEIIGVTSQGNFLLAGLDFNWSAEMLERV